MMSKNIVLTMIASQRWNRRLIEVRIIEEMSSSSSWKVERLIGSQKSLNLFQPIYGICFINFIQDPRRRLLSRRMETGKHN